MVQLPTIHLIHVSDAAAYLERLKEILNNLKAEHRINKHVSIDAESSISLSGQVQEEDMVLLVLSKALEPQKEEIEVQLRKLKQQHPGFKVAEVIVDQVPYENEFITFPSDLKPIRSRENMDAIWTDIEQSLRDMFPVSESEKPSWVKYLKYAIPVILLIVALFFWKPWSTTDGQSNGQELFWDETNWNQGNWQ